ncbi:hypothetical protein ACOMHN_027497 [Nucella lapillus]
MAQNVGASSGIGEGTALLFAKHGCHLTLTGRDGGRLGAVVQQCVTAGCPADKIVTVLGDLREKSIQQQVLDKTVSAFGRIDILVNNAGVVERGNTMETTEDSYDQQMDVNVKAVFFLSKLLARELIKTKGNIVNVSSICSSRPMGGMTVYYVLCHHVTMCCVQMEGVTVYCVTKAAMDMFTQCLALELAPHGVRVNSINPGSVVSRIHCRGPRGFNDEEYAKFLEIQRGKHPLGGVATPEDAANTIAYLASDLARFVSGTSIYLDGARHCVSAAVATSVPGSSGEEN